MIFSNAVEEQLFNDICSVIGKVDDKSKIFKSRKADGTSSGPFSPTIYESVMVGIAQNCALLKDQDAPTVEAKIVAFVMKAKEDNFLGAGSNTIKKLNGRLNLARNIIK